MVHRPPIFSTRRSSKRASSRHGRAPHELDALEERPHVMYSEHGILAAESDVAQRPPRAYLRGARQHRLEFGIGHADGARIASGWSHGRPRWLGERREWAAGYPTLQPQNVV
jgi:hypothetical protein